MATYKVFRITNITRWNGRVIFYLDGHVNYSDEPDRRIDCADKSPYNSYRENEYLEIDVSRTVYYNSYPSERRHIFDDTSIVRSTSSVGSARNEMINASSVNPTALAVTREGMDRINRGELREFEYKMEDAAGNKHHWIYRK